MKPVSPFAMMKKILRCAFMVSIFGFGGGGNMLVLRHQFVSKHKLCTAKNFENAFSLVWLLPGPVATKLLCYLSYRTYRNVWAPALALLVMIVPGFFIYYLLYQLDFIINPQWIQGITGVASFAFMISYCLTSLKDQFTDTTSEERRSLGIILALSLAAGLLISKTIIHQLLIFIAGFIIFHAAQWIRRKHLMLIADPVIWLTLIKTGLLVYGGAYGMAQYLFSQWCERFSLISNRTFWHALALGHIVPGPMMNFVSYIGIHLRDPVSGFLMSLLVITPSCMLTLFLVRKEKWLLQIPIVLKFAKYLSPFLVLYLLIYALKFQLDTFQSWILSAATLGIVLVQMFYRLHIAFFFLMALGLGFIYTLWSVFL